MGVSLVRGIRSRLSLALLGERAVGRVYRPVLFTLSAAGVVVQVEVNESLKDVGLPPSEEEPQPDVPLANGIFPEFFNTESLTRVALWRVVRLLRPKVVVETGIANGVSTRTILSALEANGHGHLFSFDVDERTVDVVAGAARNRWTPIILNRRTAMSDLEAWANNHRHAVDIWYHDSDHGFDWQMKEYLLASRSLEVEGLLMSDDIDGNEAFAKFAVNHPSFTYSALFDTRKVVGLCRITQSSMVD